MPVSICPRCKHINPEYAIYCHFDGVVLQAQQNAVTLRLPSEFAFPSGRRCRTYDELAQGCQEEWASARDLLLRGVFAQFFRGANRADLVRAADDAKAQSNPDIALTTFLGSLPGTRTQTPKLDLNPRRIMFGAVLVGETKTVPLTLTNQGAGMLQGTVSVTEGQDWLSLSETGRVHEIEIATVRDHVVKLTINTKGIAAGQTYGAKLTVVTNGGVVEVPMRMDLVAQPFAKPPFQGIRSQRELAEKVRLQPRAAVPIFESGEVERWFILNGWTYPVHGSIAKGLGGVQQFFEGMGVSRPPPVHLSQNEFRFTAKHRDTIKAQVTLQSSVKKWVFAEVSSQSPWLKPTNPQVAGQQHATVPFEVDTNLWNLGPIGEGMLTLLANGGQKLTLKVVVEVLDLPGIQNARPARPLPTATFAPGAPPTTYAPRLDTMPGIDLSAASRLKYVPALMTMILLCLLFRITMAPLADGLGRSSAASSAAAKLGIEPAPGSPFAETGGWLQLPWLPILAGADGEFKASVFQPGNNADVNRTEFRHYFASYFIRWLVLRTWWLGALAGVILILRRGGGPRDIPWGLIAGAATGLGVSATLAAFFLVAEMIPHALWHFVGAQSGFGALLMWTLLATLCWLVVGVGLGVIVPLIAPVRRLVIDPLQGLIASLFRVLGMNPLADYWSPE